MPLQSDGLVMLGLGMLQDQPPHPIQPPLDDGIHLRFGFDPERGFPWHGYYLFRRPHRPGKPECLASAFGAKRDTGRSGDKRLDLTAGSFSSPVELVFSEAFAPAGTRELDLRGRPSLRFDLPPGRSAREFQFRVGFFPRQQAPPREIGPGEIRPVVGVGADPGRGTKATAAKRPASIRAAPEDLEAAPAPDIVEAAPNKPPRTRPGARPVLVVTAYDGGDPVARTTVSAAPGEIAAAVLAADRMDSVEIEGGPAALIDLCVLAIDQNLAAGWRVIPEFTYPLCLPTAATGYPCPGRPANAAQAEALALGRIRYGPATAWAGGRVAQLCSTLDDLAMGGPGGSAMVDRTASYTDAGQDPDAPVMPDQRPLDLVLLASLNPAVAQMVGLYWVDDPEPADPWAACIGWGSSKDRELRARCKKMGVPPDYAGKPGVGGPPLAWDYLLMADHSGRFQGDPDLALAALTAALPADVDAWICFGLKKHKQPPLPAPVGLTVYALPGGATDPAVVAAGQVLAAGLRWTIPALPSGELPSDAPIGYHLWRASLGAAQPTAPAAAASYVHLTPNRMIMVAPPPLGATPQRAGDWPPFRLDKVDGRLAEGWYAYTISGMDIFGRISLMSGPAAWRQWAPPPSPRPWYYANPVGDRMVNPWAVRLIDKTPPPRPPAVEAQALDPDDPALAGEAAYDGWKAAGWWAALSAANRRKLAGLRVRWRWDPDQMAQAPRTKEFRIYFSRGTDPPGPDYRDRMAWSERVHVVPYNAHFTPALDENGAPTGGRQYEVLLPVPGGGPFAGIHLKPTDADPIAYGQVGVSAADDRTHTGDDAKWASGGWGGLTGNEGRVGGPAKVYRVLRTVPDAPPLADESDKVWATRADYHSRSYYTFRWFKPGAGQKVHVFRTMDDTLFETDWDRRGTANPAPLVAGDLGGFGWSGATRQAVAAQLNGLDAVKALAWKDPKVRAAYEALAENALRALAGLPGNEAAFVQVTYQPLDPADPANADRAGPDARGPYTPDPALGAWLADLDGKASNAYFFRAAYVNSAHTVGPLGPASPLVYLPKVAPPRTPAITKVTCGELAITLSWAHNREPDFAEYRIYRADDDRQARDVRLMKRVAKLAKADVDLTKPAADWTDTGGLIGGRTYIYRLASVDTEGNESPPSEAAQAVAVDSRPPDPPTWTEQTWLLRNDADSSVTPWPADGVIAEGYTPAVRLGWWCATPDPAFVVNRRAAGDPVWTELVAAISSGADDELTYTSVDLAADASGETEYRIRLRAPTGLWSSGEGLLATPPESSS